jgi:hypothetical protein
MATRRLTISLADVSSELEETKDEEVAGPKWVQVTREGNFPGYDGGTRPFAFTRANLQEMVNNIRTHHSYSLDADSKPVGRIIPWDFNHASERDPTSGVLPVIGAPAQAWTLDLEVREGEDGKAELWALTEFLEPARTYVRAGQYQWASVSVQLNAVDPETGKNVGTVVSSIALTNTPFVEGMETLVAAKNVQAQQAPKPGESVQLYRRTFYESAKTPQDAINCMKEMFGLSETSGVAEVARELGIVKGWFASGEAPLGTDPDYLVGSLRTILNLPSLTPPIDVLEYAMGATSALVQDQALTVGAPASAAVATGGTVPPVTQAVAASRQKDPDMSELLKGLAGKLGVFQSDAAVISAVDQLVALQKGLKEIFSLSQDDSGILLGAAKKSASATDKLKALLQAIGVEDADASVAKVQELMASAARLKEVMPELEGLKVAKKEKEEADITSDVAEAIAAHKFPDSLKGALLLQRRNDPKGFAEQFPKVAANVQASAQQGQHQHLLAPSIARAGSSLQLNAQGTGVVVGGNQAPLQSNGQQVVNLSLFKGANRTARAKSYLSTVTPGWEKMDNETQWSHAVDLCKQPHVTDDQPVS